MKANWVERHGCGLVGGISFPGARDGVVFERHGYGCRPGFWSVAMAGWSAGTPAVVDDFGNLVRVQ